MILQNQVDARGIAIILNIDELYPGSTDCQIYSDEQRIMQVVLNLVSNAVKFTDQGGLITICA